MTRYRGDVEKARRFLRERGASQTQARRDAPKLAAWWAEKDDRRTPPFSWLGTPATGARGEDWPR